VPVRPQQPAARYLNGRAALNGLRLGGPSPVGGMAVGRWGSTRSTFRSRAIASIGYLAEHAALPRYLTLVVDELPTGGAFRRMAAQPSNGRLTSVTAAV